MSIADMSRVYTTAGLMRKRAARLEQLFPRKDTKIEVVVQNELIKLGITFTKHEPIIGQPDIFVEPNLCIFVDGTYWHSLEKVKKNDECVHTELKNQGLIVLRFPETMIKNDTSGVLSEILANMH